MDTSTLALIGLVVGLVGAIVGSFAYLTGENRKTGATARRDTDALREYVTTRLDGVQRNEQQERQNLRVEFVSSTQRIESDLKRLAEQVVRRSDVEQLESRLSRTNERLEGKIDNMSRMPPGAYLKPGPAE